MNSLDYAQQLVRFDSTCHHSNLEVSEYLEQVLQSLGCETERLDYRDENGELKVNVLGRRGSGTGGLAWFGHTDVVVSDDWSIAEHGPFEPTVRDGRLYGRGSTDMKGPMACLLAALESVRDQPLTSPIYVSCSSDEEINHRGAIEISERSQLYRELIDGNAAGIVGEPTSLDVVYAHKGGCQIHVTSQGKAAHSSTREGVNANWAMIPFLQDMKGLYEETESEERWMDHEFDPPTIRLNLGINDHTQALNITAPQSISTICFRPMPDTDVDELIERIVASAERNGLICDVKTRHPAFYRSPDDEFVQACATLASGQPPRTVSYGSEACNFTEVRRLVVLGPGDIAQAHKSDEWISLDQLEQGASVYRNLLKQYCQ
ncbi:MAG: M20 family metallopeptidase [Planctomycetaceae bacterium]|nr:M20 family metallopeptidase [Planctomycetaceae bacterium]